MDQIDVELTFQIALQYLQARRLPQAESLLKEILARQPGHAAALHLLGVVDYQMGRHDAAVELIRRAIAAKPDWPEAYANLGSALRAAGQYEEAIVAYRRAIVLAPNSARAWNACGWVLRCLGRFDEAAECFRRAVELDDKLGGAHQNLADIGEHGARPEDIAQMSGLAADESLPVEDRVRMGFALGKLLDDADRFDEAFAAYAGANSLYRAWRAAAGVRFDPQGLAREVDQLIGEYTPSRFEEIGWIGSLSETPVFIVGMPRSGTSLVEQIAASHRRVFGAGEIKDVGRLADALGGWGRVGGARNLDVAAAARLADAHVARLAAMSGGAERVIDKMLDNTFMLALIAVLFPASRIIFCHRDARDTCLSCYFRLPAPGGVFARDLSDCAHYWIQTDRVMKHWRAVLPLRMLDIQYEELVADLEGQSRRLIEFLGLPWDPACLDFHRTQRPVLTFSNWQVRQPLYSKSVGRWRHYQRHLGAMLAVLGEDGRTGVAESRGP